MSTWNEIMPWIYKPKIITWLKYIHNFMFYLYNMNMSTSKLFTTQKTMNVFQMLLSWNYHQSERKEHIYVYTVYTYYQQFSISYRGQLLNMGYLLVQNCSTTLQNLTRTLGKPWVVEKTFVLKSSVILSRGNLILPRSRLLFLHAGDMGYTCIHIDT